MTWPNQKRVTLFNSNPMPAQMFWTAMVLWLQDGKSSSRWGSCKQKLIVCTRPKIFVYLSGGWVWKRLLSGQAMLQVNLRPLRKLALWIILGRFQATTGGRMRLRNKQRIAPCLGWASRSCLFNDSIGWPFCGVEQICVLYSDKWCWRIHIRGQGRTMVWPLGRFFSY